jgi:serine/threonine protein kinase
MCPILCQRNPELVRKFRKEIETELYFTRKLAPLRCPNIVKLAFELVDCDAYGLELCSLQTLEDLIFGERRGLLAPDFGTLLRLCTGMVRGVAAMHTLGVVHRDLKPENVLLNRDRATRQLVAVIADFGMSYDLDEKKGKIKGGTFAYASPEAVTTKRGVLPLPQPCNDVWSLGCILFEAGSGQRVWTSRTRNIDGALETKIGADCKIAEVLKGDCITEEHILSPISPAYQNACSRDDFLSDFTDALTDVAPNDNKGAHRKDAKFTGSSGKMQPPSSGAVDELSSELRNLFFEFYDKAVVPCFERDPAQRDRQQTAQRLLSTLEDMQRRYKSLEDGIWDAKSESWTRQPCNPYRLVEDFLLCCRRLAMQARESLYCCALCGSSVEMTRENYKTDKLAHPSCRFLRKNLKDVTPDVKEVRRELEEKVESGEEPKESVGIVAHAKLLFGFC